MRSTTALLAAIALCAGTAAHAGIYKCVQQDGKIEYSSVPCGPTESVDYITGDTFSVSTRCPNAGRSAVSAPLGDREIRRQQRMAGEAGQSEGR